MIMTDTKSLMYMAPVIPVIVVHELRHAQPLAQALVEGGLKVLEVTLRTDIAMEAMIAMQEVNGAIVGVGTAMNTADLERSQKAGAQFAVSPGYTSSMGKAAKAMNLPLLPGVSSGSEIMQAAEDGYTELKFFPAKQAGGAAMLKAFAGPFKEALFCPTGGINIDTANDYLALPNVACVGGSWVAPAELVNDNDWSAITELAKQAKQLPN